MHTRQLVYRQRERCSPNHMAPSIMNCMRDKSHEADGSSPVDQVYAPLHLHEKNDPRQIINICIR
jgi:hypothetical protein